MNKAQATKWVNKLLNGGYKQGMHRLVSDTDDFCCLGVMCDISKTDLEWKDNGDGAWKMGGKVAGLPQEVMKEFGMSSTLGRRKDWEFIIIDGKRYNSLAAANDFGVKFKQIAAYVKKNYMHF